VNADLVPALNVEKGGVYRVTEPLAQPATSVNYLLVEQETTGKRIEYGPFAVTVAKPAGVTQARIVDGALEMHLLGEAGAEYVIESTDDVANGRWEEIGRFTSDPSGVIEFHQPLNGAEPGRFYRALRP
jgi:hypothetical protein